jgi:hypothetical protein
MDTAFRKIMGYYAKFTGPYPKTKKFLVEIWKTSTVDEINYEEMINSKFCWTFFGAYKWAQKSLMRYTMYEKFQKSFLKDSDIIRKEYQ